MFDLTEEQLSFKSEAFRRFYASLQDSDPRDGPQVDIEALRSLHGDEGGEAESLLIGMIERWGGPAIEALAEIKSLRGASVMKGLIKDAGGITAAELALGLWRIEGWPQAQSVLIDVLEGRSTYFQKNAGLDDCEWNGRMEAARALAYIPGAKSETALNRALADPDNLVRHWAQISLNVLTSRTDGSETSLTCSIRNRRNRRKYDWFGYAIWFVGGMLIGGIPIFFHLVLQICIFQHKFINGCKVRHE